MPKKEKIHLQHSSDLDAVDSDLAAAMEALDAKNRQVDELLRAFDPPQSQPEPTGVPTEENVNAP